MRAIALLTLDKGSVLYNPNQMPDEVVLKHTDGEIIKIERKGGDRWLVKRRKELEMNFWQDGQYSAPVIALATLADRQAFGFRLNGQAVNPLVVDSSQDTETLEIESLDLGAVIVEGEQQLPLAVFTTDEVYYRIYVDTMDDHDVSARSVLERRDGPHSEWNELDESAPTEPGYLIERIADQTGMESVESDVNSIEAAITERQELFKASHTEGDDKVRERMAIQNETAFAPSMPKPRPVGFPE